MRTLTTVFFLSAAITLSGTFGSRAATNFSVEAVSVRAPGLPPLVTGSGDSLGPVLSADGRFVVFVSSAPNLVTNDTAASVTGGWLDLFVRDLNSGKTTLVSINSFRSAGGQGDSVGPDISADGRFVAFESSADDLVVGDTNQLSDVFVRDMTAVTTSLLSQGRDGAAGNGASHIFFLTPNGRFVLFESDASNLVENDTNGIPDVFVRDLQSGTTTLVSVNAQGGNGAGSAAAGITPDGRFVVFASSATNLIPQTTGLDEVYVRDTVQQQTLWASTNAAAIFNQVYGPSTFRVSSLSPSMSEDGRYVAFTAVRLTAQIVLRHDLQTGVTDLILTNNNVQEVTLSRDGHQVAFAAAPGLLPSDVYLWDDLSRSNQLISVNADGTGPGDGVSDSPVISPDHRLIAFLSSSTDLTTNLTDGDYHLYIRNLQTGKTELVDVDLNGEADFGSPVVAEFSTNGNFLAFESRNPNIVAGDGNNAYDVFVRNLTTRTTVLVSASDPSLPRATGAGESSIAPNSASGDGRYLVFISAAEDLVVNDGNLLQDVFLRDLSNHTTQLISVNTTGVSGNDLSWGPVISTNGRFVAFVSVATDLVPNDSNGQSDIFLRDRLNGTTKLVSANALNTGSASGDSAAPTMSADGRFVCFESKATNLVPGVKINAAFNDVFIRDTLLQTNFAVSLSASGTTTGDRESNRALISPDGRFVVFESSAQNLGSAPVPRGLYLRDLVAGTNILLTTVRPGIPAQPKIFSADGSALVFTADPFSIFVYEFSSRSKSLVCTNCTTPSISANGSLVAAQTFASTLVAHTNQITLFDRSTGRSTLVSAGWDGTSAGDRRSSQPAISPDGSFVAFASQAANLIPSDTNGLTDVFVRDLKAGVTLLVSRTFDRGLPGLRLSNLPVFAGDSRTLIFQSSSPDLVPGDFNLAQDVFVFRLPGEMDSDADGLPDNWERVFFGNLEGGGSADGDGDGQTNWEEFIAGTNPVDASSILRLAPLVETTSEGYKFIAWAHNPNRTYTVQYKTNLTDPEWLSLSGAHGSYRNSLGFFDLTTNATQRFYRVLVTP